VAEAIPQLASFHGAPSMIGVGLGLGRAGYGASKYLFERQRYKAYLARRLAEARRLTTPFSKQPDLVEFMRAQREQPGPGYKTARFGFAGVPHGANAIEIDTRRRWFRTGSGSSRSGTGFEVVAT
jgi:hypothetical protein